MSEIGEDFDELRKFKKEKRRQNKSASTGILIENGVSFESKNEGSHLIVKSSSGETADFWPSTGLFIVRGVKQKQRGVRKLLKWSLM